MFRAMMTLHWKWLRQPIALLSVGALLIPSIGLGAFGARREMVGVETLITYGRITGALIAALAVVAGLVIAVAIWSADERGQHIYSLSLPVDRSTFLRLRSVSGLLLLLPPTAGIYLGLRLAAARFELPASLQAYAGATALRALAVMALAFAVTVALRQGASRMLRRGIVVSILVFLALTMVESSLGLSRGPLQSALGAASRGAWSPLAIIFREWRIIDL